MGLNHIHQTLNPRAHLLKISRSSISVDQSQGSYKKVSRGEGKRGACAM